MCLLCINEIHVTDTKVVECCEGVQICNGTSAVVTVWHPLYMVWCLLHQPVPSERKPSILVLVIANKCLHTIMYYNTTLSLQCENMLLRSRCNHTRQYILTCKSTTSCHDHCSSVMAMLTEPKFLQFILYAHNYN